MYSTKTPPLFSATSGGMALRMAIAAVLCKRNKNLQFCPHFPKNNILVNVRVCICEWHLLHNVVHLATCSRLRQKLADVEISKLLQRPRVTSKTMTKQNSALSEVDSCWFHGYHYWMVSQTHGHLKPPGIPGKRNFSATCDRKNIFLPNFQSWLPFPKKKRPWFLKNVLPIKIVCVYLCLIEDIPWWIFGPIFQGWNIF